MATIDLGRVTPIFHGNYDNSATYELNDIVLYNGALYWHVSDTPTTGILPTDATAWTLAMAYSIDETPTQGSDNAVMSGGVYDAIEAAKAEGATAEATALAAFPTDTASGSIATFADGADGVPVKSLEVQITPAQEGSGDPTPTNVRPIAAQTNATISVGAVSGTADATYTATWSTGIYGGTADVATGELVSDMRSTNNFGSWNLILTVTPNYFETANIVTTLNLDRRTELLCNKYKTATPSGSNTDDYCCGFTTGGRLRVRDSRFATSAAFAASLADAQFVYPLATPTSAEFDPIEVKTLYGDNNIWADTGDVTVQYRADTTLYIDKKLGA